MNEKIKEGKLSNEDLKTQILDKIQIKNPEIIVKPGIGEDCSAVAFGEQACILTIDPITGSVNDVGRLAVHVSCNDVASCGVKAIGILVTVLGPVNSTIDDFTKVMDQISHTCKQLDVEILGGHTEVTSAVNRFVVVTTAVGKCLTSSLVKTSGAIAGDKLVMTKAAGLEGSAIIASDKYEELSEIFSKEILSAAKAYIDEISVVKEGVLASSYQAHAMHDITEGGVLGAAWEMAEASGLGIEIFRDSIPIRNITQELCKFYNLNPLRLISSGSMLIACANDSEIVKELTKIGIQATTIGRFTEEKDKFIIDDLGSEILLPPISDEIYKII